MTINRNRARLLLPLLSILAIGFTVERLAHSQRAHALDFRLQAWVVRQRADWPAVTALYRFVTRFGDRSVAVPATVLVAAGLYVLGRRGSGGLRASESLTWLGTVVGGRLLGNVLKGLFQRPRPPTADWVVSETFFSFPSVHSEYSAVFCTLLALYAVRGLPAHQPWLKAAVISACAALAVLVATSRVWLGVHYPADVLAGLLVGLGWVLAVETARRGWASWRKDRSRRP